MTIWIAIDTPDSVLSFAAVWLVGLADDAATAVLLGLPFLLGLYLLNRVFRWRTAKVLAHLLLVGLLGLAIFAAVAEVFFWDEYNSRFNGIAVYYLIFPKEVLGNIRESFDLRIYLPAIAAVVLAFFALLRRRLTHALETPLVPGEWRRSAAVAAVATLLALPFLHA
ncbi:MAG: hypothetical protein ACK4Z4_05695, partial [Ferrovibrio sp.]